MYFNGGKSSFLVRIKRSSLGYSKKRYPFNTQIVILFGDKIIKKDVNIAPLK